MDRRKNYIQEDWTLIEDIACVLWKEEWSQLNPLEINAIEEIIENQKSLDAEILDVSGGMGCDFSVDLEKAYYLLAILWYIKDLLGLTDEEIRLGIKKFIESCNAEMQFIYKEYVEPQLNFLISLMKKKFK